MRFLLFSIVVTTTFSLGLWAYKTNYESRAASQRVKDLEKSIVSANKVAKILNAEWAHLNSPDRLRKLVEYYFLELKLTPIDPDDFISFSEIYWDKDIEKMPAALSGDELTEIEHDKE